MREPMNDGAVVLLYDGRCLIRQEGIWDCPWVGRLDDDDQTPDAWNWAYVNQHGPKLVFAGINA